MIERDKIPKLQDLAEWRVQMMIWHEELFWGTVVTLCCFLCFCGGTARFGSNTLILFLSHYKSTLYIYWTRQKWKVLWHLNRRYTGWFLDWSAPKNECQFTSINPIKKVLSVRISKLRADQSKKPPCKIWGPKKDWPWYSDKAYL